MYLLTLIPMPSINKQFFFLILHGTSSYVVESGSMYKDTFCQKKNYADAFRYVWFEREVVKRESGEREIEKRELCEK